jgi:O-antigen ligase
VVLAKHYFTLFFLLGGLFLELTAHPQVHFAHLRHLPRFLRAHPPLLLVLFLALWMGLATALSPEPQVALTGSVVDYSDGLVWGLLMVGVFVLGYVRSLFDPDLGQRVALGVLGGAGVLALGALAEVALHRGLYYTTGPGNLPMVTFPGRGHLAGYFALGFGVAAGFFAQRRNVAFGALLLLMAVALGLTFNRAGILALLGVGLAVLLWRRQAGVWVVVLGLLGVGLGWGTVRLLNPQGERAELASGHTLLTRLYYWKAALGGIAARPLFGWGGGVFEHRWPQYLSREELEAFLQSEFGYPEARLLDLANAPGGDPVFVLRGPDGHRTVLRIRSFRAHNGFLEVALKWGLLGLALYLSLLLLALRGLPDLNPGATGLLALHAFFLFWFAIPEGEGAMWALWGAALGAGSRAKFLPKPSEGRRPGEVAEPGFQGE